MYVTKLGRDQTVGLAFLKKTEIKNTGHYFGGCEIWGDTINGYLMDILNDDLRKVVFVYSVNSISTGIG